jgi:hypothetical protein
MELDLTALPSGAKCHGVTADILQMGGRTCTRVTLSPEANAGVAGVDYIDMPTFLRVPAGFRNGSISVEIFSRLRSDAPDYARAFAGIAFRIDQGCQSFESVYLRPLNGLTLNPPPPRNLRAVQYFAYPDWKYDRLRELHPDGGFEAGADIGPSGWITLRLDIDELRIAVTINGATTLTIPEAKSAPRTGDVGLWVDIGTEAYFSNLVILPD